MKIINRSVSVICASLLMLALVSCETVYCYVDDDPNDNLFLSINHAGITLGGDYENITRGEEFTGSAWIEIPYTNSVGVDLYLSQIAMPDGLSIKDADLAVNAPKGDGTLKLYIQGATNAYREQNFGFTLSDADEKQKTVVYQKEGICITETSYYTFEDLANYFHDELPEGTTWKIIDTSFSSSYAEALAFALYQVEEDGSIELDFSESTFASFPAYFSQSYDSHTDEHNEIKSTIINKVYSMILPETCTSIGARGMRNMDYMTNLEGTQNIKSVGGFGIRDNDRLTSLNLASLTYIDSIIFGVSPITELYLTANSEINWTYNGFTSFTSANCNLYLSTVNFNNVNKTTCSWGSIRTSSSDDTVVSYNTWKSITNIDTGEVVTK